MTIRSVITACGGYLPEKIVTNADMEKIVDTTDEWIQQRTGIKERHMAAADEKTSDMAIAAAKEALLHGSYKGEDIDGIIVATCTPDNTFPSIAIRVQDALDIPPGLAFDVQAVCSGFIYALSVANSFIQTGLARRILVIGAEKMTSILNWDDRATCVLFGDGAGAIVLEADEAAQGSLEDRGVLSTHLYANGHLKDLLYTTGGGTGNNDKPDHVMMEGRDVFRHAVQYMSDIVNEVLEHNHISPDDIDWLVPHQANIRIIEATAKKLDMSMDQVIVTVDRHGNTSAASIPLALNEAVRSGQVKQGDLLLMEALGAGLTWGAALVRF